MQTLTDIIILPYFIYIDLYANRLVKSMPKIGTFQSHGDRCNLWFCKNGRYIPGYCSDGGGRECGEILVSTGLRLFYEKASILIEIIENLKLPFGITFVEKDELHKAITNQNQYVIAFLSCDLLDTSGEATGVHTCLSTKQYINNMVSDPMIAFPRISKDCQTTVETSYLYDNKKLGDYSCNFPKTNAYIVAKKNLKVSFPAVYTLLNRMNFTHNDISQMSKYVFNNKVSNTTALADNVKAWMLKNSNITSSWSIGCRDVPGKFGIEGKCERCPPGKISKQGENHCTNCKTGEYTDGIDREICHSCPIENTISISGSHGQESCKCIGQLGTSATACSPCPTPDQNNSQCVLGELYILNGFWRKDKATFEIFPCPNPGACIGTEKLNKNKERNITYLMAEFNLNDTIEACRDGHMGVLCDTCIDGYRKDVFFDGFCHKCEITFWNTFWNILLLAIFGIGGVKFLLLLSVSSKPDLDTIHFRIAKFREQNKYDHVCIYFRDHIVTNMRFLDHSGKNDLPLKELKSTKDSSKARNRRISRVSSIFTIRDFMNSTEVVDNSGNRVSTIRYSRSSSRSSTVPDKEHHKLRGTPITKILTSSSNVKHGHVEHHNPHRGAGLNIKKPKMNTVLPRKITLLDEEYHALNACLTRNHSKLPIQLRRIIIQFLYMLTFYIRIYIHTP